jgi:uncharacterized protein
LYPVYVITDLVQIRRLGEKKRNENNRFRRWLERHKFNVRELRAAAEEVHDGIDCRQCAECCRVGEVDLSRRDVDRLARHLSITPKQFREQYTTQGRKGESLLRRTKSGCVFLEGNDCSVYEARPKVCEFFPNLLKGMTSIQYTLYAYVDRTTFCPIVYNWMEKAKELTDFRK